MATASVDTRKLLSETKFFDSYSRWNDEKNRYETWDEAVDRVMSMHEGFYNDKLNQIQSFIEEARTAYKEQRVLGAQRAFQKENYKFIDIRTKKERDHTGIIANSLEITAFDIYGNFVPEFMKTFQDLVDLNDNVVFISNEGKIASILANGFAEQLGAENMHALKGGIQELISENYELIKN